ncbi:hypothetical protein [Roseobacter sp. MH60115]|uniref:hypothetical protein n=1 Tax=Roseobacter sp. MH60115 TaxID=2785324 RepID=UPI0018A2F572|nr:hypothetical protein [Roseobacter sp. MH60115]
MSNPEVYLQPRRRDPNLFRAALNDDVGEMLDALSQGQSLSTQDDERLNFTPVHIAAERSSNKFLAAAAQHPSFDPWVKDANDRVPWDHARAFNNVKGMKLLHDSMYNDLKPDPSRLDYSDNEPSDFYPG